MNRFTPQYLAKLSQLKEDEKSELVAVLEALRGRKCLVVERSLRGLFGQLLGDAAPRFYSEHGVFFQRELGSPGAGGERFSSSGHDLPDHIVYIIRPTLEESRQTSREIADAVNKRGVRSQFHVFFVPSRSVVCEQIFEDEGCTACTTFGELGIGMLPLDTDLLTMEMPCVFKQCYLDGDTSSLGSVARALLKLQRSFGVFPRVSSKGAAAKKVLQLLLHYRREEETLVPLPGGEAGSAHALPDIDTMVLLDRDVDLFSAMVSPLTYEGLIDEVVGIHNGKIRVDASVLGDEKDELKLPQNIAGASAGAAPAKDTAPAHLPGEKVDICLDSSDATYADIRDLSIEQLGAYLQDRALQIKTSYSNFREKKDASIVEIHDFVKKIPKLTSEYKYLTQHINIAQLIRQVTDGTDFRELWQMERGMMEGETFYDQIEDAICADADRSQLCRVLRLMALQSITGNGIRAGRYDQLRRLVIMTYGFQHTFTLNNLEKIGLLKKKDMVLVETASSLPWNVLRKNMRLINESVNMVNPTDMAYVSAGYAPLSARLIQNLAKPGGWAAMAETHRLLPGPVVDITQTAEAEELARTIHRSEAEKANGKSRAVEVGENHSDLYLGPGEADDDGEVHQETVVPQKPVMLVVLVGGLSFIEVAALRFLSKSHDFPYSIVMASTAMINGNSLIDSIVHNPTISTHFRALRSSVGS